MGLLNWLTDEHTCDECGEFFPKSVLITMSGYSSDGTYCTVCAKEIIKEEMEE